MPLPVLPVVAKRKSKTMNKLLLCTAGTVAAGVGREFLRQIKAHAVSGLEVKVRYLDTYNLADMYPDIQVGEWFHLRVDSRHMHFTHRKLDEDPCLKKFLYPGLIPETDGTGGGSIRYNGAGAVEIARNEIKAWIKSGMDDLARGGDRQTRMNVAVVVSAVGATGSGSLERLIELIIEAALDAGIPTPIRLDTYILQPGGQGMTDLLLANTLALYAELAASRLSHSTQVGKLYQGRTIMVGWGTEHTLTSLEQLQETAATLIRLTTDLASGVAAQHQGRQIDKHVLREDDPRTGLPSHLSTATPITISLGDLALQVLQADVARILSGIVLGTGKESEACQTAEGSFNPLDGPLHFLKGEHTHQSYKALLNRISEGVNLRSLRITPTQISKIPDREQATQLKRLWQGDKDELAQQGRPKIQKSAAQLVVDMLAEMKSIRQHHMTADYTLLQLYANYQDVKTAISSLLKEAGQYVPQTGADESNVLKALAELDHASRWGRQKTLIRAVEVVHRYLYSQLERETHAVAVKVLHALDKHCAEALRDIGLIIQMVKQERHSQQGWGTEHPRLEVRVDHPLHLPALSDPDELELYYRKVSLFASQTNGEQEMISEILADEQKLDPLADFRQWLIKQHVVDVLFSGDFDQLHEVIRRYAQQHVEKNVQDLSVVDVLQLLSPHALQQRIAVAAKLAHSLVPFSEQFAPSRSESRYVSAMCKDDQRAALEVAISKTIGKGDWTLIRSNDPTEIDVFLSIDGLTMGAVNDLSGRCFEALLQRRKNWYRRGIGGFTQMVGVPVYSGLDAEQRVYETGIIRRLYEVRGDSVGAYTEEEVPELGEPGKDLVDLDKIQNRLESGNGLHSKTSKDLTESRSSMKSDQQGS
jgi:hypothetical protein